MTTAPDSPVHRNFDCSYQVSDDRVLVGASLGNSRAWVVGKATGALQKMYALAIDQDVFWSTVVTYGSPKHHVLVGLDVSDRTPEERIGVEIGHVIMTPVAPGTFEFHPGCQRHRFELPSDLEVCETLFVPRTGLDDPAVAYVIIDITNHGETARDLTVHIYAKLAGTTPKDVVARYDPDLRGLIAWNRSQPQWVRILASSVTPRGYQTLEHAAESYDPLNVPPLTNDTSVEGNIVGVLGTLLSIPRHAGQRVVFTEIFSERGEADARAIAAAASDAQAALSATQRFYAQALSAAEIITPEKLINDGAYWAKANMTRVIARYPQGVAFTNDPGNSAAVVGRDLAWFTFGCDYLNPAWARQMLLRFARTQDPSGKMPEYYHGVTGRTEDYGLNINDDTPLFILACWHHYQTSGDAEFVREVWPAVRKAADYILSQRDERGLVVCTARGEAVYGIAGWRNIIPRLTINGAVTEVNAECYAALAAAARMAQEVGGLADGACPDNLATWYRGQAEALRDAINHHLINPKNGMYLLNIDVEGRPHADVTGDEVFPVMFGVAPPPVAYRIISRLNTPDFQTEAGLRTVSRLSPDYTPYRDVGLIGGVWPGLSFWYAFAAAKIYPDAMARNLTQGYAQYLRDPKMYNTVPGQFSEWFDGESLVNRGMRLSPWEPPRYLWAAIEGACGLALDRAPARLRVSPLMPSGWRWLGVRRLPLGGRFVSYFVIREGERFRVFANAALEVDGELELFDEDVTERIDRLDPDMVTMGLRRAGELLICVGSTLDVAYTFPLSLARLIETERRYQAHLYNASLNRWVAGETAAGREFRDIALRIEAQSFSLARFVPCDARAGRA